MSMKNANDTIGNRTRDLPGCSAVPQPTAPPRTMQILAAVEVRPIRSQPQRWMPQHSLLRRCATNRKFAGSIPAGVTGTFH